MCQSALGQIRLKPGPKMGEINSEGAPKMSAVMTYTNLSTVSRESSSFPYVLLLFCFIQSYSHPVTHTKIFVKVWVL